MIAVVPSGPGVFGFAPFDSSRDTAARSPRSAASISVGSAALVIEANATNAAMKCKMQDAKCKRQELRASRIACILNFEF
jgi:hypothetical protein